MEINYSSKLGGFAKEILDFYIPLLLRLPSFRDDPKYMKERVKATGKSGLTDVATRADTYVQQEVRQNALQIHPEWKFWGEEAEEKIKLDSTTEYVLINDPIEGTNNFKFRKDDYWGSVIAVVDLKARQPVIGIVAQPMKRRLFIGIRGEGAYTLNLDEGRTMNVSDIPGPEPAFTYNNSPHFEPNYARHAQKLIALAMIQPELPEADEIDRSRKTVLLEGKKFADVEAGALEPILFKGGIMFKTNVEVAAAFVIINEIGGRISNAEGKPWSIDIRNCIFARNSEDWKFLKRIYDKTL